MQAPLAAREVAARSAAVSTSTTGRSAHANFFRSIELTKRMMFFILLLVVAVAAFNIVSTLVMAVKDKRPDIAILRTIGAATAQRAGGLLDAGHRHRLVGTLGWRRARRAARGQPGNAGARARSGGRRSHFLDASVYLMSDLPAYVEARDVALIGVTAFVLCCLSTVYPAWRARNEPNPARALRHD